MAQYEHRLVNLVLTEHFGPRVALVGSLLVRHGAQTVGDLVRAANLASARANAIGGTASLKPTVAGAVKSAAAGRIKPKAVREALFVLLQQGLAAYAEPHDPLAGAGAAPAGGGPSQVRYALLTDRVVRRNLNPRYVSLVETRWGRPAAAVVAALLLYGKLTETDAVRLAGATDDPQQDRDAPKRPKLLPPAPPESGPGVVRTGDPARDAAMRTPATPAACAAAFETMLEARVVRLVYADEAIIPADRRINIEQEALSKRGPVSANELAKLRIDLRMAELRQANERLSQVATFALQKYGGHLAPRYGGGGNGSGEAWDSNDVRTATAGTIPGKRPYNGALFDLGDEDLGFDLQGAATKRARTAHGATATAADDAAGAADETDQGAQRLTQLAKTPFFAVNTDRLHILMRSTILARHASLRINKRAGAVYEAVLDTVFDDIGVCRLPGLSVDAVGGSSKARELVEAAGGPNAQSAAVVPLRITQELLRKAQCWVTLNSEAVAAAEATNAAAAAAAKGVKPEPGTAAAAVTAAAGATPLVAVPVPFNPYALPMERLQDFLDALAADSMGFLVPASEASDLHGGSGAMGAAGGYRVAFDRLRPQLLARYMETFITDRFGRIAARLWRCLLAKGRLEERHLAKLLLVPEKAAREVLYQLLEAGLVFLQDVPRSADHAAQRTYFLWFVDIPASTARLAQRTARTLGNVKQRYAALLRQRAHLVAKLERSDVKLGIAQLSDREQVMAKDLERRQNALHAAELRLLEGLLLLEDL